MVNTGHQDMIHDAQYDYYATHMATCSSDGSVKVFEGGATPFITYNLNGHSGPVWCVSWAHPKFGTTLASAGYDGTVIVWQKQQDGRDFSNMYTYTGHKSSVNGIKWAPVEYGEAILATCSSDTSFDVLTYSANGWEVIKTPNAHSVGVNGIDWEPYTDGTMRLATCGADNSLKVWKKNGSAFELETKVCPAENQNFSEWVRDVAFRPSPTASGSTLLACCSGSKVFIFERVGSAFNPIAVFTVPALCWRVSWSDQEGLLAAACSDNNAYVFKNVNPANIKDWKQVKVHSTSAF
eukprot:TRINITY_DN1912_c9_g1_i1.p1 TRINITY_DN1912_c9_g1~~TRINITY_DN1912_c9_g1_i1.p1  ORF type:complete len:294 (+),score=49.65 TRINITY_DN1912_c9_g1_i1:137-1018(+)